MDDMTIIYKRLNNGNERAAKILLSVSLSAAISTVLETLLGHASPKVFLLLCLVFGFMLYRRRVAQDVPLGNLLLMSVAVVAILFVEAVVCA
ncbi:MAG: hypothetical protein ACP5MK_00035 [Candidatus Micrarchaeia archaeon]